MKGINDRIKAIAAHYGIKSYAEFGRRVGLSPQNASNYLKGKKRPDVENLSKIQRAFREIDADWLLTGKGGMLKDRAAQSPGGMPDYKEGEKEILSGLSTAAILRYITEDGADRFKGHKVLTHYIESLVFDEMRRLNLQLYVDAIDGLKGHTTDEG